MTLLPASSVGPWPLAPYNPNRTVPGALYTQYRPGAVGPIPPPAPPTPPDVGGYVTQDGDHLVTQDGDWLTPEGT